MASVLEQIRKLDEQKAELLSSAKTEALAKANDAIKALAELGFNYRLVEGSGRAIGTRRSGIRQLVLDAIKAGPPGGITRADLIVQLNADDKSGQQSVSNAVAALKRQGLIDTDNGVYRAK